MKIYKHFVVMVMLCPVFADAEPLPLDEALGAVYRECNGIEDSLDDLKKMAGINTAITGIGTGLGVGATVAGIKKASIDKTLSVRLEKTRETLKGTQTAGQATESDLDQLSSDVENLNFEDFGTSEEKQAGATDNTDELQKKSKNLGNLRTGLLAGTTVTGIAGAIIADKNKTDQSLKDQVENCISAMSDLRLSYKAAQISGEPTFDAADIITACEGYDYIDLSKIDKRATGAKISSIATATTGGAGTIVSALANSKNIREDSTTGAEQKEKNLNTTANILAASATVSSAVATAFNASQISVIKKLIEVAENCSDAL